MKPRLLAVLALVASWVILLSPPAALADPAKEAELLKRIEQLEKRVTELEKAIKKRPSVNAPATETEKKLVGSWVITDDDKKTAADKKISPLTDLKMIADRTCAVVFHDGMVVANAKYQVTEIGSVTLIDISWGLGQGAQAGWGCRIASATETELVLEYGTEAKKWVKVRYTRKK
jgi:hypothetical protein